jgi:hypothetical protein
MDLKDLESLSIFMGMAITETIAGNIDTKTLIAVSSATNVLKSILEVKEVANKIKHIEFMLESRTDVGQIRYVGQEDRRALQTGDDGEAVGDSLTGGPRPSLRTLGRTLEDGLEKTD